MESSWQNINSILGRSWWAEISFGVLRQSLTSWPLPPSMTVNRKRRNVKSKVDMQVAISEWSSSPDPPVSRFDISKNFHRWPQIPVEHEFRAPSHKDLLTEHQEESLILHCLIVEPCSFSLKLIKFQTKAINLHFLWVHQELDN